MFGKLCITYSTNEMVYQLTEKKNLRCLFISRDLTVLFTKVKCQLQFL